jgi:ferritin-like metal-binding protein YciE
MLNTEPDTRTRVKWTLHALLVRQHAMLAALISVKNAVQCDDLRHLIERHIKDTRTQLQRLQYVCKLMQIDLAHIDGTIAVNDMQKFAHEMAQGMLDNRVDLSVIEALSRLAVVEHGLYHYARTIAGHLREHEVATLLGASEAEEEHFIHRLSDVATVLHLSDTVHIHNENNLQLAGSKWVVSESY